jgi:hypothetical protein
VPSIRTLLPALRLAVRHTGRGAGDRSFGHGKGVGTVSVIGMPSSGRSNSISARSLRARTNSELERIVRDNAHDAAVLSAVHRALIGRTRKKAVLLRTEIRERLGLDRSSGLPSRHLPIWTRAPLPPMKPWYRKSHYVLSLLGCVAVGMLHGVGFDLWQMIHNGVLRMAEWWQFF